MSLLFPSFIEEVCDPAAHGVNMLEPCYGDLKSTRSVVSTLGMKESKMSLFGFLFIRKDDIHLSTILNKTLLQPKLAYAL